MNSCYEIYSDESGSGEDRFEAIGTLSGSRESIEGLRMQLVAILAKYRLTHCEYKKVSGATRYDCALDFLRALHRLVVQQKIKVMVLVWDKHDIRHSVIGRDDVANVSIMYYCALKTTKRQWRDATIDSNFFPDELNKVDFKSIITLIENTRIRDRQGMETLFGSEFIRMFPIIASHRELVSAEEPITQLIDIITGIVRISYEDKKLFSAWRELYEAENAMQDCLFPIDSPALNVSKNKTYKFKLIHEMDGLCKGNTMQVALRSSDGFESRKPSNGYFFWKYAPQHLADRAPVR